MLFRPAFHWHFFHDRFAQALASCAPQAVHGDAMAHYAHYRLGLYRTAADMPAQQSWYSVLASLASQAACGRTDEVAARVRGIVQQRAHLGRRAVMARALAPTAPELSLQLIEDQEKVSPALRAALLMRSGRTADAARVLERVTRPQDHHAELPLLRSNAEPVSPARQLARLNEFIGQHGLAPLALRDGDRPPSALNLLPATEPAAVDGPLVSVLMTAWRAEGHIAAALESLQRQSWRNLEIVVVDDASDDATGEIVQALARDDTRIRYLRLPCNGGTYVAKNIGLARATSDLVTCHDADDFAHPERIRRQVEPLLRDERLVFSTSNWVRMRDDGSYHARPVHPLMRLNPASPLFRKSVVLKETGAWDCVRTGADSEFHARLRLVFGTRALCRVPLPLTFGAHRPGSLMTAAATGYDESGMSPTRLAYWEAWSHWHIAALRAGGRPKLPAFDSRRHFAAPAEIDVPPETLAACLAATPAVILVASRGIARIERLETWLGHEVRTRRGFDGERIDAVAGWGRRPSAERARRIARQLERPCWSLEDGFLRSLQPGRGPLLSMVVDDIGIYHDATGPSRLELLIAAGCSETQARRAANLRAAWCEAGVSKYNHMRDPLQPLPASYVLVADQTRGDAAIAHGLADARSFDHMLEAALRDHPNDAVLVKLHPDVVSGRKPGHFDVARLAREPRIRVVAEDAHPPSLLAGAKAVYVVSSQLGFEALLYGKPVHTFGMPFYAGWGLTIDALPAPERRGKTSLESLVHAALVAYPRYLDPESGERCEVERAIEWMALQRRQMRRFPAEVWAVGFSGWKRPVVEDFFRGSRVRFVARPGDVPGGATAAVWGLRDAPPATRVIRLEDGFLRSVGLGTDLVRPLSWVQDEDGLYHDARQPSRLERLLAETEFDSRLLQRAARLRQRIVEAGLSKYNVGGGWRRPVGKARVILVPGQVESDASLAHGQGLRRNVDLLRAVRQAHPYAHLVYKPHPDVVAALRRAGDGENEARRWCDEVVTDAAMPTLLSLVDEVHVMTSLSGFEALLRGLPVVTHGQPFYAGWGLTQDQQAPPRPRRQLGLDALVAGCLILYPSYVSRDTRCFTTPERAIDELLAWRSDVPQRADLSTRLKRVVLRCVVGVR